MKDLMRRTAILAFVAFTLAATAERSTALPPPQTLNFDFGDGPGYVGDDGVLSSPDGTFWNRVTAEDLNTTSDSGLGGVLPTLDEFGNNTAGEVFSPGPNPFGNDPVSPWADPFGADWPLYSSFPLVDGLVPNGDVAQMYLFRVEKFEEMIVYFSSPLPAGGFVSWQNPAIIDTPFADFPLQSHTLSDGSSLTYIRVTSSPPRPSLLGAGRTIGLSASGFGQLPLLSTNIAAIQILGAFGLPEPTTASLLCLAVVGALSRRHR
ncbi:MAG: PEP-CTERM sorting domain-containing protein [Planctomycetota bacterium]